MTSTNVISCWNLFSIQNIFQSLPKKSKKNWFFYYFFRCRCTQPNLCLISDCLVAACTWHVLLLHRIVASSFSWCEIVDLEEERVKETRCRGGADQWGATLWDKQHTYVLQVAGPRRIGRQWWDRTGVMELCPANNVFSLRMAFPLTGWIWIMSFYFTMCWKCLMNC